jgi:hypothetical protein
LPGRKYPLPEERISLAWGWKDDISCLEGGYELPGAGKRISAV